MAATGTYRIPGRHPLAVHYIRSGAGVSCAAMSRRPTSRQELIADTALTLLAERGMRGLTHRAVDEAAGLAQGSTSNVARTRAALLEAAVRRLALREAAVLTPPTGPHLPRDAASAAQDPAAALADTVAQALHHYLTDHRQLLVARYELALEATRRPELREIYDRAGREFRETVTALLAAAGATAPERQVLGVIAWCDGMLFSCTAGQFHTSVPTREALRTSCAELLGPMLAR